METNQVDVTSPSAQEPTVTQVEETVGGENESANITIDSETVTDVTAPTPETTSDSAPEMTVSANPVISTAPVHDLVIPMNSLFWIVVAILVIIKIYMAISQFRIAKKLGKSFSVALIAALLWPVAAGILAFSHRVDLGRLRRR